MMVLIVFILLALVSTPAQAQLQFDSQPAPTVAPATSSPPVTYPAQSGLAWLQRTPMTLFDLGMLELGNAANKIAETITGLGGAVAEFQEDRGRIAISFYSSSPYERKVCVALATQAREGLFMQRKDTTRLARELGSYFISYGPPDPNRPRTLGAELVAVTRITIYMNGGTCELGLLTDEPEYWEASEEEAILPDGTPAVKSQSPKTAPPANPSKSAP